jgi:hypothetical protein
MPHQNRVTPLSTLIATPVRGRWMGNRGCLHDAHGTIRRSFAGTRWIFCELEFKDRRRPIMRPGHFTELFFLDEATALAAGHRPCAECMRPHFEAFRQAWASANPLLAGTPRPPATVIDAVLHAERLAPGHTQATHPAQLSGLPTGCMVAVAGQPALVLDGYLLAWQPEGYGHTITLPAGRRVEVLTPMSVVRALAIGYRPDLHPSARGEAALDAR